MAFIMVGETSFFSKDTYQAFVERKNQLHNERLRSDDETIFNAA